MAAASAGAGGVAPESPPVPAPATFPPGRPSPSALAPSGGGAAMRARRGQGGRRHHPPAPPARSPPYGGGGAGGGGGSVGGGDGVIDLETEGEGGGEGG